MTRTRDAGGASTRWVHRLATIVAVLMALAAAIGLGLEDVYRDNPLVRAGWRGNDVVTLLLAAPLLAASTRASAAGWRKARLVTLGMLLYAFYNYAFYLFGAAFNALFLVYVAVVTLSGAALFLGLLGLDVPTFAPDERRSGTARAAAAFMVAVAALLGIFWAGLSLAYLFTGEPPAMVAATDHPTNVTGALDLSLVVALGSVAGVLLWCLRPWGYVLAVVWNVKGATYMLALSAATVTAYLAGAGAELVQLALWVPIAVGCTLAAAALLRSPVNGR